MDSLPPELHLMIFQLLPVPDTIRLRLVSKSWNRLLLCLRHRFLTVVDNDPKGNANYLAEESFEFRELESDDSVKCRDENLLLTTLLSPMFQGVKKLKTLFYSSTILKMSQFYNQFRELEELDCFHFSYYSTPRTIILNLPCLKKFVVQKGDFTHFDLRTPCLAHLEIISFTQCDLYYPDRLRKLEANLYDYRDIDFSKLVNLEILIVNGYDSTFLTNSFLVTLQNLKELHFNADSFLSRDTMNLSYRRDGLRLYLFGLDIDKPIEMIEEFNPHGSVDWEFPYGIREDETIMMVRNYENAAETVYYKVWLVYNVLAAAGLDKVFLTKLPRIGLVKVAGSVEDEDALLEFLVQAKSERFEMENQLLSQRALNELALRGNSIRKIILNNLNLDITSAEFEFIFKMKALSKIVLNQLVSFDFLIKAFEHCEHLTEIDCSSREENGQVNRGRFSPYDFIVGFEVRTAGHYFNLPTKSKTDLLFILRTLQREVKPNAKLNMWELCFLIESYEYNYFLVENQFKKMVRNEFYYIYC